ncbi:MAG: amidohydrolase family protein [Myxococcota bacterium]
MSQSWDVLIRNATIFDGNGGPPLRGDIAMADGRIAERGPRLDPTRAARVIDATGLWAMPGLVDVHTHYDLELELAPGLVESVRHGTTTVVISNCSLGLAFGAQRGPKSNGESNGESNGDSSDDPIDNSIDPIVDCFARVENMPKRVIRKAADRATWSRSGEYLEHLDQLNLGPNVVPMIPHSMLRIAAMGFTDSIRRDPTPDELRRMQHLLRQGLDEGYAGLSTDALPFHYLANDPNRRRKVPTQYARYRELAALTGVVRELDRVWQATPAKDRPLVMLRTLLLTSGRLFGRPLRTTVVAALDVVTNRLLAPLALLLAWLLNSWLVRGRFTLQALPARFKVWSDGIVTPIAEEIPELRELNEPDLEDREGRRQILGDPEFVARFCAMWNRGKRGFGLARLRRVLRVEDYAFSRSLDDMVIDRCPVTAWEGMTLAAVYERLRRSSAQSTDGKADGSTDAQVDPPGLHPGEREILAELPTPFPDEAHFLLRLLATFDTDLQWYTVTANADPVKMRRILMNPRLMPGFSDSGAHLTNMAFYDVNLRALKIAREGGDRDVGTMVRRLTRQPAELFGVDAGSLEVGGQADVVLVDPDALAAYDGEANVQRIHRAEFEHTQLVNRSDGVVRAVFIAGVSAWENGRPSEALGRTKLGRRLSPGRGA